MVSERVTLAVLPVAAPWARGGLGGVGKGFTGRLKEDLVPSCCVPCCCRIESRHPCPAAGHFPVCPSCASLPCSSPRSEPARITVIGRWPCHLFGSPTPPPEDCSNGSRLDSSILRRGLSTCGDFSTGLFALFLYVRRLPPPIQLSCRAKPSFYRSSFSTRVDVRALWA